MAWGKFSAWHLPVISTYKAALHWFDTTNPIKRSKYWASTERPLITSRERWYKLIKRNDCFAITDGGEDILRFFEPEADGTYEIWLSHRGWGHSYAIFTRYGFTHAFQVAGRDDGSRVEVPYSWEHKDAHGAIPAHWSAILVFDKNGHLLLDRSFHRPIYVRVTSAKDKQDRKDAMRLIKPIFDLLQLRMPTFHQDSSVSTQYARHFRSSVQRELGRKIGKAFTEGMSGGSPLTDAFLEPFMPFCQDIYNSALSRSIYRAGTGVGLSWNPEPGAAYPAVPWKVYYRALRSALLKWARLSEKTQDVELPKFLATLPAKYYFTRIGK